MSSIFIFFFFQAEDGIRDVAVTGVQTCALPIFAKYLWHTVRVPDLRPGTTMPSWRQLVRRHCARRSANEFGRCGARRVSRSEERRVGKECRSRWSPYE